MKYNLTTSYNLLQVIHKFMIHLFITRRFLNTTDVFTIGKIIVKNSDSRHNNALL